MKNHHSQEIIIKKKEVIDLIHTQFQCLLWTGDWF